MKARVLMKKIGTANGKPCSLVVVEERVAAQQGCHMFDCSCGIKFWTQYYAAFHVKKAHAGEKPVDSLKLCCDLSCDLDVLAKVYINVSDNIHAYLQHGEEEILKRKREDCEMDSSPQGKRLLTADLRNRVLMKKIGTANGKPCSLVVVEETVAAQQGCHMFECSCGIKFWTQYYAAFHVKKAHAGEKPVDRLKLSCDLSCDLDVLAKVYINVSDNIHAYLQGGEEEILKRKREDCEMDSSPQAKRLLTADLRNRSPLKTPTEVKIPEKFVETPHSTFPASHLSLSPVFSSATKCFSISPVPLLDPRLLPRPPKSVYCREMIGAKLPVSYSGRTLVIEENQNAKMNNSPNSNDHTNLISCEPPIIPTLMQACNFSFKSSSVQKKSANTTFKEQFVDHGYSNDLPLNHSSSYLNFDEKIPSCNDPSCVTEKSDQNTYGVNGLEVAIDTETMRDRFDEAVNNIVLVESRGEHCSTPKSESDNEAVTACICGMDIISNHMVECEQCITWQHAECYGIRDDDYVKLANGGHYYCVKCRPRKLPLTESGARNLQTRFLNARRLSNRKKTTRRREFPSCSKARKLGKKMKTDGNFKATDNENGHRKEKKKDY